MLFVNRLRLLKYTIRVAPKTVSNKLELFIASVTGKVLACGSCLSSLNALCRCVVQKGRKRSEIEKAKRGKFMGVKSPFVAFIFNKYGYVITGICFEDSLRLLLLSCIE
jgi:hypothetical protein